MYKRLLLLMIIVLSMVFIGCEKEEVNKNNNEQGQKNYSYQIKCIDNSGFSIMDTDVVYELIKDFITSYYKNLREKEDFDLSRFVKNSQFTGYIQKKCEVTAGVEKNTIKRIDFGIVDIDWDIENHMVQVKIASCLQMDHGSVEYARELFLIEENNKELMIVDWYSTELGGFDEVLRGNVQSLSNPRIWEDTEWVEGIYRKMNRIY